MSLAVEAKPFTQAAGDTGDVIKYRGKCFYIDHWIDQVKQCRYLPEEEMRILCAIYKSRLLMCCNIAEVNTPATICGDIHGQFYDLMSLFDHGGSPEETNYVFMGDYVDRGHYSLETLTYLFLMAIKYPGKVTLLRGNHETRRVSHQYGFYEDCGVKYNQNSIWRVCCDVFDAMPVMALIDEKILCVHGGISPQLPSIDTALHLQRKIEVPQQGALCDLVWSDPDEHDNGFMMNTRGAGWIFGRDVTEKFVKKNNLELICRSHQLVQEGFKYIFDDFCCTVWSAPNYCYRCGNMASVLKILPNGQRKVIYFAAVPTEERHLPDRFPMLQRQMRERREFAQRKILDKKKQERDERLRLEKLKTYNAKKQDKSEKVVPARPTDIDDEYRWAGCDDPLICITTSHDPSSKLKQFAKEVALMIPNAKRVNRGNNGVKAIMKACKENGVTDVIFLHETQGKPDAMVISHLPHGPTAFFSLHDVIMRHDTPGVGHMPEQAPHLMFEGLNSKVGHRVTNILKYLFPVAKRDSKRIMFFGDVDREDYIFFRHYAISKDDDGETQLDEVGPRFTLFLYAIINDTLENERAAESEFSFKPYLRAGKKVLSIPDEE
uniref:Serine/threonine-protein phosphatase n=1 Tax=Panagrolaimus sp. JU765 TaxID=591449 RepID=A0AC34R6D2_9BILA